MIFDLPKKPIHLNFSLVNIPTHFGKKKPNTKNQIGTAKSEAYFFRCINGAKMQNTGNTAKVAFYSFTMRHLQLQL